MKPIEPELKDRIQISVKDDRDLRSPPDLPDAIEYAGHSGAGFESALGGQLIHQAIGQRIGERHAQLENVDTGFFERESDIDSAGQAGIAGADIGDERFFIPLPKRGETLVDSIWHSR